MIMVHGFHSNVVTGKACFLSASVFPEAASYHPGCMALLWALTVPMDAISGRPGPPRDFSYSRDLRTDGYAGAVVQMDHLLGQIADLLIEALDD
jgi:hypothetical protein